MPRLNVGAVRSLMLRRNFLFKHQFANHVSISYARLAAILADGENEVEEEIVKRLCTGLECERADILEEE